MVALADDVCPQCATPFLPSDATPSLHLPGVGDVARLDKPQRAGLMIGGTLVIMLVLVALAFLFGSVL